MAYKVMIRRNSTGEELAYNMEGDWDEAAEYLWQEGNYSCDCNRGLFWNWAADIQADPSHKCGTTDFTVRHVELEDGTIIPVDYEEANQCGRSALTT